VKVDTKLKKLGALAFIAALDHRQNGNKERMDRMLQLIADWVEDDPGAARRALAADRTARKTLRISNQHRENSDAYFKQGESLVEKHFMIDIEATGIDPAREEHQPIAWIPDSQGMG
jgi:hypothetical protein